MRIPAALSLSLRCLAIPARVTPRQVMRQSAKVVIVAFVFATGCNRAEVTTVKAKAKDAELESIDVQVLTVTRQRWPVIVRSQGSLDADEQSVVGSKVSGRVEQIHVDLGDFVHQGDPLITLDQADARLMVMQAEAQLRQARAAVGLGDEMSVEQLDPIASPPVREAEAIWDEAKLGLKRSARLLQQNAIAQSEYDQADAQERVTASRYSSALNGVREKIATIGVRQAELSMKQQQLDDAIIRAPLDGYVQQRNVAPGSFVSAGQSIAVIVRTNPLRFRGTIPERHAQSLRVGQGIRLQIESESQTRTATVTRINPTLNQQSRTLEFEAEIANHDRVLRSGLFAQAEVEIDSTAETIVIPESAIVAFAGTRKVWKVTDGVATEQPIAMGERREDRCEIIDGLAVGDTILVHGEQGKVANVQSTSADAVTHLKEPSLKEPDDSTAEISAAAGKESVEPAAAGSS